jgi:hypothetical protein
MQVKVFIPVSLAVIAISVSGQVMKLGGDKGCPKNPAFIGVENISGDDFLEVHQLPSFGDRPVYTMRVYADGRIHVAWRS